MTPKNCKAKSIFSTTNYDQFHYEYDNRQIDAEKRRKLRTSMEQKGFIPSYPIICKQLADGLYVKDGQNRLQFARELQLPVWYTIEEVDFDVAEVAATVRTWKVEDYHHRYVAQGKPAYRFADRFAREHGLPLIVAYKLLNGTSQGCLEAVRSGTFEVRCAEWAKEVATTYTAMCKLEPRLRNERFLSACMAAHRVDGFDGKALVSHASSARHLLGSFGDVESHLDMMERVYNFRRRSKLVPLKVEAMQASRARGARRADTTRLEG